MAKIPTYESRATPSGSVVRPATPDYSIDIAQKLVGAANKVLDAKAIDEGFKQGKIEQQKALEEGRGFLEQEGYTLRSEAFNKGANAAYVAGMKTKAEQELTTLATEINDPLSKIPINERVNTYNERKEEIRNNYFQTLPAHLQGDLGGYFDSIAFRYGEQVFANQRNLEVNEIKATIANRVDTALETLPALIRDFGYENNQALEEQFGDIVAAIDEGLGTLSPSTAVAYKEQLKTSIQVGALESAYNKAEDKEAFIKDLEAGGDVYKSVMQDINETYFDGDVVEELEASGPGGYKTLAKQFEAQLKNEKLEMVVERNDWTNDFNQSMALFKSGIDPNYPRPDEEEMKRLGFTDAQIDSKLLEYDLNMEIYPDVIGAKTNSNIENKTSLVDLNKELNTLVKKENKTAEDRIEIGVIQAKIEGIGSIYEQQVEAMQSGNPSVLLDMAGIEYDTTTEQGIDAYHTTITNKYGMSPDDHMVAPKAQVEQDAQIFSSGDFTAIYGEGGLADKYGKHFEKFIADAGLTGTGHSTVAITSNVNPNYANQMFNALQDYSKNMEQIKIKDKTFTSEDGAFTEFQSAFEDEFGEYYQSMGDMAPDIIQAYEGMFLQAYNATGNSKMATTEIIKQANNAFQTFEHRGLKMMLPVTVSGEALTSEIDNFIANPQKYGIVTGSLFDINDFKKDLDDNTFDNYAITLDGGKIKLVNPANTMGYTTFAQKRPSGPGELMYSNSIKLLADIPENTETVDVVDIWEYDTTVAQEVDVQEEVDVVTPQITEQGEITATTETAIDTQTVQTNQTTTYEDKVDQKIQTKIAKALEEEQAYQQFVESQTPGAMINQMQSNIERFDKDGDGNVMGEELVEMRETLEQEQVQEPTPYTVSQQAEDLLFEYKKLENAPIDPDAGTLTSDGAEQDVLNAVSMYVKSGKITESIIQMLAQIESFSALENDAIASEVLLNWKDNMNRTTIGDAPTRMSPIMALYDYVRELEDANVVDTRQQVYDDVVQTYNGVDYIQF